jgi:branched-chain amino acid transport system ATP-binding protein
MTNPPVLLSVEGVSLLFGGTAALADVSFDVRRGEIRAIIGPNGAGKTSILNCISGFYRPQQGRILYTSNGGEIDLTETPPHQIAPLGIARTFQNIALYTGLSTLNNLMAARHLHMKQNSIQSMLYWGAAQREEVRHREVVEEIIDFLEIAHIRKAVCGALPYGLRKRVELGRALAMEPKLLLLDEPMAGMNVEEKEDMARFILDIYERRGITIVLIEHDMGLVMDISDRVVVLDFGVKIADDVPDVIRNDERVIQAYLGEAV